MELQYGQLSQLVRGLHFEYEQELVNALVPAFAQYEINTANRLCACLAQFAHETMGFTFLRELGNDQYFSKYDFRKDLGNNGVGMGAKYKGRGFIQLTGYTNYSKADDDLELGLVENPQLVEQPPVAAMVSCWWWDQHNLNDLADRNTLDAFKKITRIINGGFNGLASRCNFWDKAKLIWV